MNIPLAERMRPTRLDDVVGQTHLIGEGKILTNILKTGKIPNMIFYGPSGTGKTTVANICANASIIISSASCISCIYPFT